MESELSPDTEKKIPPVPLKTYQWEDLRRAREAGGYPWTHLNKSPLEGEVTAEDIIRSTTPRRSMSREVSTSRTQSPDGKDTQKILNLNSSPGSSRKHNEDGTDEGVHVPNFSKEISLDTEDDIVKETNETSTVIVIPDSQNSALLTPCAETKNVSPKSILKRRVPEEQYIGVTETREKTKCCHPLVNKIKHLADKTLHKLERNDNEKSPISKRKKNEEIQEIRQLRNSPGAVKRQKFSAIKLGSSDEVSKTMSIDTPPLRKRKEHIYEDIEETGNLDVNISESPGKILIKEDDKISDTGRDNENIFEKKSIASQDPSLVIDDDSSLKNNEHIMEHLYKRDVVNREAILLDDEKDHDEPNVDEIFQNQLDETRASNESPNIMITEIRDDDNTHHIEQSTTVPIETSPSPSPREYERKRQDIEFFDQDWSKPNRCTSEGGTPLEKTVRPTRESSVQLHTPEVRCACQFFQCDSLLPERINPAGTRPTSRASNMISNISDHEYEIIEKPPPNIIYTAPSIDEHGKENKVRSSTASLEQQSFQHTSENEYHEDIQENFIENHENIMNAEELQKDIEDRFFAHTPSTLSRTECEISTSQVDSSALENLPLKRENRNKNGESLDSKIQQRLKESTGKIKAQAGKLKTKLHNLRTKQFSLPEKPKGCSDEQKTNKLPDKRKFSLPDRPKFKKINLSEKLSLGDRKKFSLPERPKFTVPDLPKFKIPEKAKLSFPSLGRKKSKPNSKLSESSTDLQNVATVDFEAKTYPRLFNKTKKLQIKKTSSSPVLNREDTPPPTFTFTRMKTKKEVNITYIPDSPEQPREYGTVDNETSFESETGEKQEFVGSYDFANVDPKYFEDKPKQINMNSDKTSSPTPNISPPIQKNTHINELNNDEFFVRPRGISRENIQVREYLSDEIRQAFNIPKNVLAAMGSDTEIERENIYINEMATNCEITVDDNDNMRYSNEDINERDDGYYTFPPIRPSRAKRKNKELDSIKYVDESVNASRQFSEVDLSISGDHLDVIHNDKIITDDNNPADEADLRPSTALHSVNEYTNDDIIEYPDSIPIMSQTLPMPPKRKKKYSNDDLRHSSYNDFNNFSTSNKWETNQQCEDVIVYRTEYEYVVPHGESTVTDQSPVPPRRTRSRSSRCTSLCDDDRTSHGAESLTLDSHLPPAEDFEDKVIRHESPGYAIVDKGSNSSRKHYVRANSRTPPLTPGRRSHSSERKYYTVTTTKTAAPNRPPRKKSSSSLMTLDSFAKQSSMNGDSPYDEIEDQQFEVVHKDLKSGIVLSKMKGRPLPPPPRPPRGPRRSKDFMDNTVEINYSAVSKLKSYDEFDRTETKDQEIVEIEVSTQTDPLPDDVDFELGIDDNLDVSMSSSLRDIIDEESMIGKNIHKATSPLISRLGSRSERSLKCSDPKLGDLSKSNIGRTSPTVILVERRVSSPTRINHRDEILTEASLTVKHIDIEESKVPDVPPLPKSRTSHDMSHTSKNIPKQMQMQERMFELMPSGNRDMQIDNLVTQKLKVKDLDVGRLNVSELQASKILVSDIEGLTLNVQELDSKSGHISINGIDLSQTVIDEIVKKFAEISTSQANSIQIVPTGDAVQPVSREEETQTDLPEMKIEAADELPPPPPPLPLDSLITPQRPPPPDLGPLLLSYLQDMTPPLLNTPRSSRDRPTNEFFEQPFQTPHPPIRRSKRKQPNPHTESSSDDGKPRPSPRRLPPPIRAHEPTITEAGAQFFRVCQNSISRTLRNMFNIFTSYIHRTEDKKDVQMAMVIFLVLIAGLIIMGLSDSRTIHHHHWEFFNPPDTNK